jgi:hypothetical protein
MTEIGTRVWAVRDATDEVVNAFGFGTYIGDHLMPGWDHPSTLALCERALRKHDSQPPLVNIHAYVDARVAKGEMTREEADAAIARAEAYDAAEKAKPFTERVLESAKSLGMNPRIELDSGGWVWGAECWWGDADEDTRAKWAKGRRIVTVPAPERTASR